MDTARRSIFFKLTIVLTLFFLGDAVIYGFLKHGMDHYYGMDKQAQILSVGHSHSVLGIDAERIEKELRVPVAKYAMAGANTLDRCWMIRQFVEEHPSVQLVIYDVDPRLFDSKGLSSASYTLFLPYINNPVISKYLEKQATWQEYFVCLLVKSARFRDQTINIALRGLLGKIENKKDSRIRVEQFNNYLEREKRRKIKVYPGSIKSFKDSIEYLSEKGITVLLTFIPVIDLLNNIDPINQERAVGLFKKIARNNNNVFFLDYNKHYQHQYDLFYNLRHLNRKGNELVTAELIKDVKAILAGKYSE